MPRVHGTFFAGGGSYTDCTSYVITDFTLDNPSGPVAIQINGKSVNFQIDSDQVGKTRVTLWDIAQKPTSLHEKNTIEAIHRISLLERKA